MNNKIWDCVVIGAGISGVSFAHTLKQKGMNILLLEKADRIGGRMCTKVADKYPEYKRELGSHTCYNSYTRLISLAKSANLQSQIQAIDKGSYLIYNNEKIVNATSELNFVELLLNGIRIFFRKRDGKSVKEYFSPIVGSKNYDHLFTYLFRAVICQFPDNYPTDLFLKRRKGRDKSVSKKFSLQQGMAQLTESLVKSSEIDHILSTDVQYIVRNENNSYLVKTNKGDFITANIALACDPKTTAHLLSDVASPISNLLGKLELSKLDTINILIASNKLQVKKIAGIINTGDIFLSAVSGDLLGDKEKRTFSFHFSTDTPYEDRIQKICKVLDIKATDIIDVQQATHILPSLTLADVEHISSTKQLVEAEKNIYILGNYFYGLSLEDCTHRSEDEANRYLLNLNDRD